MQHLPHVANYSDQGSMQPPQSPHRRWLRRRQI